MSDELSARVAAVEGAVSTMADQMKAIAQSMETMTQSIATLTTINDSVTTIASFLSKHGGKVLSFGAGIMTAAGVGNPEVWKFISGFSW